MSSIQLAEFVLWKSIKGKRENVNWELKESVTKTDEIVFPNDMICRVCTTSPADIPITDKINGVYISSAIRIVSYVWVSRTDSYPQYVCKNCLEELKVALTFKRKCETSDSLFRQTQSEKADNHVNSMVKHDFALIINQMKEIRLSSLAINGDRKSGSRRKKIINWDIHMDTRNNLLMKTAKCQRCDLIFGSKSRKVINGNTHWLKTFVLRHCGISDEKIWRSVPYATQPDRILRLISFSKLDLPNWDHLSQELLIEHRLQQNCICPPCSICGKIVSNLGRHKKNVHLRTEKYTCHICGKISYSAGTLRNHLLVHSDKCDFQCPLCPYKGKQQAYLTLHMRVHTGERPYLYSECPAKFVNPSNLRKHQLTHSSKKFECNKCKKQFRLRKTLQEHYDAAHLNVRYRCSICGRDLWTRRKLLSHELRVHNREKHKLYDEVYKVVVNGDND